MTTEEQKEECWHTMDNYYTDGNGEFHCEKCEKELKN